MCTEHPLGVEPPRSGTRTGRSGIGAELPVLQVPRSGKCCPTAVAGAGDLENGHSLVSARNGLAPPMAVIKRQFPRSQTGRSSRMNDRKEDDLRCSYSA
jgi:hypothetical protein